MYTIIGLGTQGTAILKYLLCHTKEEIVTVDLVPADDSEKYRWTHCNTEYSKWIADQFKTSRRENNVVISCLPPESNESIVRDVVSLGWHYVDLGGDPNVTREILAYDSLAKLKSSTLIPDAGLAPGLVSSIAGWGLDRGYTTIKMFCGGLPVTPDFLPLAYSELFPLEAVIEEYTGISEFREDWEYCVRPALSERGEIFISGLGILESEPTKGNLSLAAEYLYELKHLEYNTLRYPGHWDYMTKHILTQPDPVNVLNELVDVLHPGNPDLLILKCELSGHFNDNLTEEFCWRWDYDHEYEIGALAQITGYTAASVATMIHEGVMPTGFVHMHEIEFEELKRRIKSCPDQFKEI